ncbi:hypothetical protein TcCL_NonESM08177 [Trypanosoma cruzi]|nr:hypothetical protein TcCL_NonESM08177 [Trypanosoma cruzi]
MSVVPSLPLTEEAGPPRPPPEPPPGVSAAPPRRTTSSGSTSPCPSCSSVFSSVHNMKAHARRTNSGTPIVAEGLTCGFCDSSTVSSTSASRAGHYRKCQAYQRAKNGQRTSAGSNDSRGPSVTPLLQPPPTAEPRQSTGGPAAHAVGMPPSSTTEHPTIWNTLSHDSTIQKGKTGHIATDSPQAINEQWLQSITKQILPFSHHRKNVTFTLAAANNEFIAQYRSELQYFLVPSRSLVDTLIRVGAHPFLPMTVHVCDAPSYPKDTSLTTAGIDFALSARIALSEE